LYAPARNHRPAPGQVMTRLTKWSRLDKWYKHGP
jgi:hypothetical protein